MVKENTLSIIKPDAVARNIIGSIINRFETSGLILTSVKMLQLTFTQAVEFYCVHKDKYFFNDLIKFMISGPVFIQILSGNCAIKRNRDIMGCTDPVSALAGTIRSDYGENCIKNVVHGSDSESSAKYEIEYFFNIKNIYKTVNHY